MRPNGSGWSSRISKARGVVGALAVVLGVAPSLWGADHRNLEEGNPIQIEDAYVIAYRSFELQPVVRFERDGERGEILLIDPELKWGVIRNGQVELRIPIFAGAGDRRGSGNVQLEGLYHVNVETRTIPATAVRVGVEMPSGEDSEGVDALVKGILTKGFLRSQVHVNAELETVGAAEADERGLRYKVGLGADHPLGFGLFPLAMGLDNIVIADVFVQQSVHRGERPLWIAELGVRHQYNPWTVFNVGAGAGLSQSAPDYLLTFGFQYSFAAPAF